MLLRMFTALFLPLQLIAITLTPNPPVQVSTATAPQTIPAVAVLGNTWMTVWNHSHSLQFSVSTNNGATWSAPQAISVTNDPDFAPSIAANETGFVVVWVDIAPGFLQPGNLLSTFTTNFGATWSTPAVIDNSGQAYSPPNVTATSSGFLVTWRVSPGFQTINSAFSGNGTTWNGPVTVDTDLVNLVYAPPFVIGTGNDFLITWGTSTNIAYSAFSNTQGATWNPKTTITNLVVLDVPVIPALTSSGYLATYLNGAGVGSSSFSSNNGATWSTPALITSGLQTVDIPPLPVIGTPLGFLTTAPFSDNSGQASITSNNGTSWIPFVNISKTFPLASDIAQILFNSPYLAVNSNGVMCVWMDTNYQVISAFIPLIQPPTNLTGTNQINRFPFQNQYYVSLCWDASISPDIFGYHIYRDNTLIATTSSLCYADQAIDRHTTYVYTVKAFNGEGAESSGISTTVTVP